jgi:hypothetical protein
MAEDVAVEEQCASLLVSYRKELGGALDLARSLQPALHNRSASASSIAFDRGAPALARRGFR